jgi:ribosome maturation factor RimP
VPPAVSAGFVVLDEEVWWLAPTALLRELAEPLLADAGLALWDVEVSSDVVRVLVDRDGGVDLEALAHASRVVSSLLERHDDLVPAGSYQLEVSSPGLERTLRTPEHYRRLTGSLVSVKTAGPVNGSRRHRGVLNQADDSGCEILPEREGGGTLRLAYDQIERAHTVFEWGPASRPAPSGRPLHHRKPAAAPAAGVPDPKDPTR